ncbi:peptide/nickel transport system permease protein [Agromyces terreus]|uniref:Peptide/nickel transport system permease protein n=1 Tax=Agromyces terreus TaxID=424795 RepID=A0A9X2H588_9MICO|nr:ABC transporter permease [Agromyces terreus]MCP2371027.1 peptide/nickel transport system permease protein [Agromyces terreus]
MTVTTPRARASRARPLGRMLAVRVLGMLAILLVLSFIVFSMMYLAPGDLVKTLLGNRPASPEAVAAIREQYHLDDPFLVQYFTWLGGVLTGDLGESIRLQVPVADAIASRLPVTLALCAVAFVLALAVSIPLGVASAVHAGRPVDRVGSALGIVGLSAPTFAVGLLLLYVFAYYVPIFPVYGAGDGGLDTLYHLVLPGITLALGLGAIVLKLTRTALLRELDADYVTSARARGIDDRVVHRLALRNALIPIVTGASLVLTFLVGGTVLAETTFALPGIGLLLQDSVLFKDIAVVQALTLLIAVAIAVIALLADLAYLLLDPRVRAKGVPA